MTLCKKKCYSYIDTYCDLMFEQYEMELHLSTYIVTETYNNNISRILFVIK